MTSSSDGSLPARLIADLVGRGDLPHGRPAAALVPGVNLGEHLALLDAVAALRRQTMPTAWSIMSFFTRRPAPRRSAATPTVIASSCSTVPARGA